jgi:hypothetical protein
VTPSRSRRPRRPETGGLAAVPSAHPAEVAASSPKSGAAPRTSTRPAATDDTAGRQAEKHDVLYVFHDPAQAIYRDDEIESLGLTTLDLDENCRNPWPIHPFAMSHAPDATATYPMREDGRSVELIEAEPGAETIDALRRVLHRLRVDEKVAPWQIAVLTGARMEESLVWRQRTFGNEVLWNGQIDDAGKSLGLAASAVPEAPSDAIACDTIRRFKGLERPVIILVELKPDDKKLERLLYVGASRATQHLIVIGGPSR